MDADFALLSSPVSGASDSDGDSELVFTALDEEEGAFGGELDGGEVEEGEEEDGEEEDGGEEDNSTDDDGNVKGFINDEPEESEYGGTDDMVMDANDEAEGAGDEEAEDEDEGLDTAVHGESAYEFGSFGGSIGGGGGIPAAAPREKVDA